MPPPLDWQQPNNTEGTAWERLRVLDRGPDATYLPFPWASWIDATSRGLRPAQHPPQQRLQELRATVCQHIWALEHLDAFASAGITDLFWSHATRQQHLAGGIRVHPFPLFPVRCHDHPPRQQPQPSPERALLFSFQGFHHELYPQATRRWLLDLPPRPDAQLGQRQEWHFEQEVYRQQVHGHPPDLQRLNSLRQEAVAYVSAMESSRFALCPSGAGPNSIRLWEALGYGAIPVILSDALRLPGPPELWRQAALFVPELEPEVVGLPALLESLSVDAPALLHRQAAGQRLWARYGLPAFVSDVAEFLSDPDAFLLQQAHARLRDRLGPDGLPDAELHVDELQQDDPTALALQVRRWRRRSERGDALVVRLLDGRPLPEQWIQWQVAVRLCRRLLAEEPAVPWALCSRHPALEDLAEGSLS